MKDFLLSNYVNINLAVVFIAAITGLLVLKDYKHTVVKYFIYFLFYVFVAELFGFYGWVLNYFGLFHLIENTQIKFNFWWVNLTWYIGSAVFIVWYYRKVLKIEFLRSILKYAVFLFLIISLASIAFNFSQFFNGTFKIIRIGHMSLIMLSAIFYLYEMLQSNNVLEFNKDINFYISAILLIWLFVTMPLVHFVCGNADTDPVQAELKWMIMLYAKIFMYLSFTVVLIVLKPKNDSIN
ncbi:hypothetical protein OS188_05550 [Xanthomarina sp. F1114]|uniref:hypothetical protein n=1 Tax=Xanthomarina sp. F1114 TaxID=2996019 RepID=UPI00225E267B|nr:hypothetical protein [Xanthomarina sp. F1114]MCX7547417.1 hypothetical protein [Xanthomarina sp. F1114]